MVYVWILLLLPVNALCLLLVLFALPGNWLAHFGSPSVRQWIELVFTTPVVLWCGWPLFERGWRSVVTWQLNMYTLIALGVGVAYAFSVVATVAPGIFPDSLRGEHGLVGIYFESAAVMQIEELELFLEEPIVVSQVELSAEN